MLLLTIGALVALFPRVLAYPMAAVAIWRPGHFSTGATGCTAARSGKGTHPVAVASAVPWPGNCGASVESGHNLRRSRPGTGPSSWRESDDRASTRLSSYPLIEGVHPPLASPDYKSTALRHPKQPLPLPQRLTEVTGPLLGEERVGELDHDVTRQHAGEPQGQQVIVHGRVLEEDRRPVGGEWQADPDGRVDHPDDPRGAVASSFRGFRGDPRLKLLTREEVCHEDCSHRRHWKCRVAHPDRAR